MPDRVQVEGNVTLRLMAQGMQLNNNAMLFEYQKVFNLYSFTPQSFLAGYEVNVTIIGSAFMRYSEYQCVLGKHEVRAAWLSSSCLVCKSGIHREASWIALSICTGNISQSCVVMKHKARVSPRPEVQSIKPSNGPSLGGTRLTIFGKYLDLINAKCTFGFADPGIESFGYGFELWEYLGPLTYTFISETTILSASPTYAVLCKNEAITVHGFNFDAKTSSCYMNDMRTTLRLLDQYTAICTLPCLEEFLGRIVLRVCAQGYNCSSSFVNLQTQLSSSPIAISPTRSPLQGGIRIRLDGDFNKDKYSINVSLGQFSVSVTKNRSSNGLYEFFSPPQSVTGVFNFSVRIPGSAFEIGSFALEYYSYAEVTRLIPSCSWLRDSFKLTLVGSNFLDQTHCQVGDFSISGTSFISSSLIICPVAAFHSFKPYAEVEVKLLNDGISSCCYANHSIFYYKQQCLILRVHPAVGGLLGGQSVQLTLSTELDVEGSVVCQFGKIQVSGSMLSSSVVLCVSPPSENAANVSLSITIDGIIVATSSEEYKYVDLGIIISADPSCCISNAGRCIVYQAADLSKPEAVRCLIGNDTALPLSISSTSVTCTVPPASSQGTQMGIMEGTTILSGNGLKYSRSLSWAVHLIQPSSGPFAGGETVSVIGLGFCKHDKWLCRFGAKSVGAKYMTSSLMHCMSPSAPSRSEQWFDGSSVSLVVDSENIPGAKQKFSYRYVTEVHVSSFFPSRVASRVGTSISMIGVEFMSTARIHVLLNGAHAAGCTELQ
ncbi:hypothetical protein GUITHDRAFT_139761 [Guillardia theta CCMP2712]|uniref:IPT/TIG domain-containing protein n=1 Tax=Guillardia theta (strain CCMP2712) TaxID=905079 RepID=L1J8V1_GUITC|nr:hypothetical protein GUITHDRAFT_139761 [Guillardia theta CCMP2712]EKX44534.1 hypothetical protein GUITHDRAFT_139761 [Guillardia theta CCMP2712]|eukprot:XP_005831514.1 hypothetical protein GUITHDRAFT_139761 [Guillardia theta CCMP2712]